MLLIINSIIINNIEEAIKDTDLKKIPTAVALTPSSFF
jgi:hypothetical protein